MADALECTFCGTPLDPAQEFTFLVEHQNLDDPAYLEHIRRLPHAGGRPLVICRACQRSVDENTRLLAEEGRRDEVTASNAGRVLLAGMAVFGLSVLVCMGLLVVVGMN